MKPRRTRAVPRLSLLGEQGAERGMYCQNNKVKNNLNLLNKIFLMALKNDDRSGLTYVKVNSTTCKVHV